MIISPCNKIAFLGANSKTISQGSNNCRCYVKFASQDDTEELKLVITHDVELALTIKLDSTDTLKFNALVNSASIRYANCQSLTLTHSND